MQERNTVLKRECFIAFRERNGYTIWKEFNRNTKKVIHKNGDRAMNVKEFQEKLNEIYAEAEKSDGVLTGAQMREFFAGMELDKQQLIQILQYLKAKGIQIEGVENMEASVADEVKEEEAVQKELVPLTPEEEAYLNEYKSELEFVSKKADDPTELFEAWKAKKAGAKDALTQYYMPVAMEIAVELNCEEIFIADLIQEANLSLLMTLGEAELGFASLEMDMVDDKWLRKKIREGVTAVIEEQTQRSIGDDMLVEKVQKLDTAIRELSEDEEDGQSPFTIAELAVILDMKADEIKDILRLAGEENE